MTQEEIEAELGRIRGLEEARQMILSTATVALGAAQFSNAYYCSVTDTTSTVPSYTVNTTSSLSSFTITSSASTSDTVEYVCTGN